MGSTASRYPPITLLQEGIHSCRDFIHLAIGILYMLSYRTVGVKTDGNFCPYLLSPTAPAPRTRCIGDSVARFARPFESRPADTVRREVYRQLANRPGSLNDLRLGRPHSQASSHSSPIGKGYRIELLSSYALEAEGQEKASVLSTRLQETCLKAKIDKLDSAKLTNHKGICIYIIYLFCKAVIICLPLELFLPLKVLVYAVVERESHIFFLLLSLVM